MEWLKALGMDATIAHQLGVLPPKQYGMFFQMVEIMEYPLNIDLNS